jgi:hypothetical protein
MHDVLLPLFLIVGSALNCGISTDLPWLPQNLRTDSSTHRVLIEPTHRNASRQFYKATLEGEVSVAQRPATGFQVASVHSIFEFVAITFSPSAER